MVEVLLLVLVLALVLPNYEVVRRLQWRAAIRAKKAEDDRVFYEQVEMFRAEAKAERDAKASANRQNVGVEVASTH